MELDEVGPFRIVYEQEPSYLTLLGLASDEVQGAFKRIYEAIHATPTPELYIRRLLEDINWRFELVGCIALLLSEDKSPFIDLLWRGFDRGSWITPQIVVTAYFADPNFLQAMRTRVESLCPVALPHVSIIVSAIAMGPSGTGARSGKGMASLLAAAITIPSQQQWVQTMIQRPDIQKVLANDTDKSGTLTRIWMKAVLGEFREFGVELQPLMESD